jgi:hypothetical protein
LLIKCRGEIRQQKPGSPQQLKLSFYYLMVKVMVKLSDGLSGGVFGLTVTM